MAVVIIIIIVVVVVFIIIIIISQLKCCGVNGRDDFKKSAWYTEGNGGVPLSCCKLKDPNRQDDFNFKKRTLVLNDILDPTCPLSPNGKSYTTEVRAAAAGDDDGDDGGDSDEGDGGDEGEGGDNGEGGDDGE